MEDVDLFWIAGSLHGRFPLLAPPVRAAVDLALVDIAWKSYVRDAGPGDTGPLFSGWQNADHILLSEGLLPLIESVEVEGRGASDHRALLVELRLKDDAEPGSGRPEL